MTIRAQHIVICFHDFARGGTERVALILARHWLDSGRSVTVLCGSTAGGVRDTADPRINVVEIDPPIPRSLTSRLRLGRAMAARLAELRPDVIFLPGNFHFILARALKRAAPGVPVIGKVSNPLLPRLPWPVSRIALSILSALVRPIDALVYMAPQLLGPDAVGMRKVVIAEPNLPASHTALPRIAPSGPPLVLAIGRMEPQKNLALALRAFAELRRTRPARMLILGEGAQRPKLESLTARLGLTGDVAMPGYSDEVEQHLSHAAALLLTSRYEGYPAVVVEALAADVPVVTTACSPALNSLIASPVHGRIVAKATPPTLAQALAEVIDQTFTSGGQRPASVAHHDSAASANAYLALFDELAPLHRPRPSP
jgi:glycosyltransferase involved in cell wall biosynthesis